MIECNCMIPVMNYGSSASYKAEPSPEQIANGVIPLDSLPAAWWNCMWSQTNTAVNQARQELGQLITELNNVLCNAGVCPQDVCTDQLYQSIEKIRQTLGNATTAGAVKSSSDPSAVAIDPTTGTMSVNCLGNAASLTTAARTVVGAVNELKSTYDQCFSDTATAISGKAPTSHASSATTYGVGNADCYGHLKISDTYTSVLAACSGVAASQLAVACVYAVAAAAAAGNVALGNTAGCALGTASAGSATTSARSDHVHPLPTKFGTVCSETSTFGTQLIASRSGSANMASVGFKNCLGILGYLAQGNVDARFVRYNAAANACYTILDTSTAVTVAQGGTGATTAANARTNLGLGSAAVCGTRVGGSVTYIPYSGTDGCPLLTSNFLAYWNGAYSSAGASNLRYYCGGAFGTAAACAATAFRASTWWPDSLSCGCVNKACYSCSSCVANCVMPTVWKENSNRHVILGSTSTAVGSQVIGYAYCCKLTFNTITGVLSAVCFNGRASSASSASSASRADCAYTQLGLCYNFPNNCNKTICGICICCCNCCGGCVYFCNTAQAPRILYYQKFAQGWTRCGYLLFPGECLSGYCCWACYPTCNSFTIYQFSTVSP